MCGLLAQSTEARRVAWEQKEERRVLTSRRYSGKASGLGAYDREASDY